MEGVNQKYKVSKEAKYRCMQYLSQPIKIQDFYQREDYNIVTLYVQLDAARLTRQQKLFAKNYIVMSETVSDGSVIKLMEDNSEVLDLDTTCL